MSEEKKEEENEKMEEIVKEKFSEKEKNLDTMMFEVVDVKNSNAVTFMKYHIDDTTTISGSFTRKKSSKKNENESFEKTKKKKTDK